MFGEGGCMVIQEYRGERPQEDGWMLKQNSIVVLFFCGGINFLV